MTTDSEFGPLPAEDGDFVGVDRSQQVRLLEEGDHRVPTADT